MEVLRSENLAKPEIKDANNVFDIQSMDDMLSEQIELPKKLIGDLIFPNEVTLIFGRSQVGKSILSCQFAEAIAKGTYLHLGSGIVLDNENEPINVLYFDFELSKSQLQNRINKENELDNFFRATLTRGEYLSDDPKDVVNKLVHASKQVNAKCIIIDNISAISGDIEKSDKAVKFMQSLMKLAKDEQYTVIVIAHTPKLKPFEPMSMEHVAGSNKINQLSDAVIGIGVAKVENADQYYIIHLKGRNGSKTYHKGNVIHTEIDKDKGTVKHIAQGIRTEIDLITNTIEDTAKAPNRTFFTLAYLYYGSTRSASKELKSAGISAPYRTISHNVNAFKDADSKTYHEWENFDDDALKDLLEDNNPYSDMLPFKDNHNSVPF